MRTATRRRPPPSCARSLANSKEKKQLYFTPTGGSRYIALNTRKAPFDNIDVRKAVAYVLDRNALRLTRGGVDATDGSPRTSSTRASGTRASTRPAA